MSIKAFRHTGIVVSDLERMLKFYRDCLGLKVERENTESGPYIDKLTGLKDAQVITVKLSIPGGALIELLSFKSSAKAHTPESQIDNPGFSHISLTVGNIEAEYQRLFDKGIKFISSPQISPKGYAKVAFCRDPEGNLIELVEEL